MTPLRPARSLARQAPSPATEAARLELLEYFLMHHDDLPGCAHASLEWLCRHAGVKRSACLVIDRAAGVLRGVAGFGIPADDVDALTPPLADERDPLVAALAAPGPVVLRPRHGNGATTRAISPTPLGTGPCAAVPLRGVHPSDQGAVGLLLMPPDADDTADISWLVTVLGQTLDQIRLKRVADELQARVQAATAALAMQNELLRRQAIELEQASRLKSQFLANMSHEFRTPLNAILGYTHMLLHSVAGDLTVAARRQLQRIDSNGRQLLTNVNEIFDITRIEVGRMPVQISEFNPARSCAT